MYRCSCLTFKVLQLHTTVLSASSDLLSFTLDMEFSTEFLPISSDNYSVPLVTSLIPHFLLLFVQFSSVAQSYPTLCDPMNCCTPGLPVHHQLPEFTKLISIESVMPSNHLILCRPLLLLPSIFPSIRVFSDESALSIRWPKYWSFSFNISYSNEY